MAAIICIFNFEEVEVCFVTSLLKLKRKLFDGGIYERLVESTYLILWFNFSFIWKGSCPTSILFKSVGQIVNHVSLKSL